MMHTPPGGVCLSAFLVVRNARGDVLFGRPRRHKAWPEKGCVPYWRLGSFVKENSWILPASHLLMEEHPDRAAKRIARFWAHLPHAQPKLVTLDSSTMPTGRWTGRGTRRRRVNHWAIGYVYEVRSDAQPSPAPWWKEMRFFPVSELRSLKIGRAHLDLLKYLLNGGSG